MDKHFAPEMIEFQSTLPQGERRLVDGLPDNDRAFQSTLPQGERPFFGLFLLTFRVYFNPRSRKGSDGQGTEIKRKE